MICPPENWNIWNSHLDMLCFVVTPEATFHCGSRKEMHDLEPKEASAEQKATSGFSQCVIDGAKKNKDGAWGMGRFRYFANF